MTSGKQKRQQLKLDRQSKTEKKAAQLKLKLAAIRAQYMDHAVDQSVLPVGKSLINGCYLHSAPEFIRRGTYLPMHFVCRDCGKDEIWTAAQQKWWYEVAHGDLYSVAVRCRPCRRQEKRRKAEARRVHLQGIAAKASAK